MGCTSGRPLPGHRRLSSMGNSESSGTNYEVYDGYQNGETESQEMGNHRVHWGDDDDDDEDEDYMTEYTTDLSSSYKTRAMSSKGPRSAATSAGRSGLTSAGARSQFTTTSAGETFEGSEYFNLDNTMTEGQSEGTEGFQEPGCFAPSLSLWYNDEAPGDILTQDVYVPSMGLTKYTYYCCLQWNAGMNGGGYCGIQDHPKGRNYIFSIWDPIDTNEKIKPVYVGPGTICEPFGGGQGLKSWNFTLGWEPDSWYTLLTRRWDQGSHTCFGFWVKHQMTLEWTHIVTVDFPVAEVYFETLSCSFLEDWEGSGEHVRRVHYKDGFKHGINGKWLPFSKAVFSNVAEMRSKLYEDRFDAGVLDDTFYLQSGGDSIQTKDAVNGNMLSREMPVKPDVLPVCVYLTSVTREEVTWEIPNGSVPQFQYIVYVDKLIYKQEINSEIRTCRFRTPPQELVELLIEDIYGHAVRSKFKIDEPPDCDPETRTRLEVYVPDASH